LHETVFRSIKWTPTRSGLISLVALFDTAVIDGCDVSRATLHNLTILKELELAPGCRILVSKRNMIIPHIEDNLDRGNFSDSIIPSNCPCCGHALNIKKNKDTDDRDVETLHCDNLGCESQRLRQLVHFAGKKAMNIEGLSKGILDQLMTRGLIESFADFYRLDKHRDEILQMEGFGEKSFDRIWGAIQASRDTTFERYLISMDIPMIGRTASGKLHRQFDGSLDALEAAVESGYDFTQIPGFGITLHKNIHAWFKEKENVTLWKELQQFMNIQNTTTGTSVAPAASGDSIFAGKTIVVTGKIEGYTRTTINAKIASLGAIPGDSVTAKTDFLVCTKDSSSKLDKARKLGVKILTGQDFLEMIGEA